jgi:glutathione S-transferase
MILIGQYDSPFVRRVGIALTLLDMPFEHRPWSVFGNADLIRPLNPLVRVPTLVLDDGDVIFDSASMIDWIDNVAGAESALLPRQEPARRKAVARMTLATGICEKAVSLFYERRLHAEKSKIWEQRCIMQIEGGVAALEAMQHEIAPGRPLDHAGIAAACMMRFLDEAHAGEHFTRHAPELAAYCAELERLPVFQSVSQAFIPPA